MASTLVDQTTDSLQKLKLESQSKSTEKLEAVPAHDSALVKNTDATNPMLAPESTRIYGIPEGLVDSGIYYAPNGYGPHGYIYDFSQGGYESTVGEWEEYPRYVGLDGVEIQSGFYGENSPVIFHQAGYGYPPQPPFGPYSPAAQMPTMGADGQLYGPSAFQYCGPIYQQALPPGAPYFPPPPPPPPPTVVTSEGPVTVDASSQRPDASRPSAPNGNALGSGPRPGVPLPMMPPHGPPLRGAFSSNVHNPGSQDVRGGFDGFRGNPANSSKNGDGQPRPVHSGPMPAVPSQPFPVPGHPSQQLRPITQTQVRLPAPQPPRPTRALSPGIGPGSLGRGYPPLSRSMSNLPGIGRAGRGVAGLDLDVRTNGNGHSWFGDKNKLRERVFEQLSSTSSNGSVNMNGHMDILNEQNRGPRISRMRNQRATPSTANQTKGQNGHSSENGDTATYLHREQYNRSDFTASYTDAKFYVIKSYSEDDVHKSIKYQVWASTPNGNKRLDAAYQEAQARATGKQCNCPIFLFFSVNASGQFCGVAEMTGPVDFVKSVEYWQQDKWSGQFSVKWHIIKDVPNSQFRHIILENNDNKPVTNSRDTQEVKFEQGVEMLNIFKNYLAKTSILDDFQFYDDRQNAMQEKKNRLRSQEARDGDHVDSPSKPKIDKGTEVAGNGSAVAGASSNGSATSGLVSLTTVSKTDSTAPKKGEVTVSELKSNTAQREAAEAPFQRKSYLRSLKEGKLENVSAVVAPAKGIDVKVSFDEKKLLVANGTGAETK